MHKKISVLFIGESWFVNTIESKGFDQFTFDRYETGIAFIQKALSTGDIAFTHMPCHLVESDFPASAQELRDNYDVIFLSDIGANTFLLPMKTFLQAEITPNKLEILREFVLMGGGLGMIGGYLTYMGIEAKGQYHGTPVEDVLPVLLQSGDDRREMPQGVAPDTLDTSHPILKDFPSQWPAYLGYNRVTAKKDAAVLASFQGDPLICVRECGEGRTIAYASDCAPHWSPASFCNWEYYDVLWQNIVRWLNHKL